MRDFERRAEGDGAFGAPGSTAVLDALKALSRVRGLALGAYCEFSDSMNVRVERVAHEGALKNIFKRGQSNYQAAIGQIF